MNVREKRTYSRVKTSASESKQWTTKTNVMFGMLFLITIVAMVAFGLALGEWVRDGKARETIDAANDLLKMATISFLDSQNIATEATNLKSKSQDLQNQLTDLKSVNVNQTMEILEVGVLETAVFAAEINETIVNKGFTVEQYISELNETLQSVRSMANNNIEQLLETGTCTLEGDSSTSISYSFYNQNLDGLQLYYYVFGTSDFVTVNPATNSIKITACNNPVLGGIPQQELTLKTVLDRFESTPENWVGGVTSSGTELLIHKNTNVTLGVSGQVKISQPLTFWLQFF